MQIKLIFKFFLVSGLLLFFANFTHAQTWQSLNGPLESSISKIIVRADTIFVASVELGGFFKKHKDASYWMFMDVVETEDPHRAEIDVLNAIEIGANGTYYAGGDGLSIDGEYFNHFYVSNNFGKSWETQGKGIDYFEGPHSGVHAIYLSANGSLIVGFGDGIYTYSEEEESFKETSGNAGVSTNRVFTFHEYEDTLLAGRVTGLEYSTDEGDNWAASSFDSVEVFSMAYADEKLFLGTNTGLFTAGSVNGTFEMVGELSNVPVHALHTYQGQLIAGTDPGAFLVNLESHAVQPVFQGVDLAPVKAINNAEDTILLGTENGIYECNLEEEDCERTGVPNSWVRALSIPNQDTLFIGTTRNIYRYIIPSERWDSLSVPVGRARSFVPVTEDSFFTISGRYFLECSFQSVGCDSTQVDPGNTLFNLTQNISDDLFLISTSTVFQSKDQGNTWNSIFSFVTNKRNFRSPTFTVSDSLLFIDAAEQGLVKYSLNTGDHSILGFEDTGINAYYLTSDGVIYVSAFYSIHKSTDLGETWTTLLRQSDVIGGDFLIDVLYDETQEKLYAIGNGGRIYVSEDEGSWGVNEEMYPVYMENAAIGADGTLYLGTSRAGIFANTEPLNPPITISNEEKPNVFVPKQFTLHQNYPNPFNPSTTVSFELSAPQEVEITIFNTFGQKIQTYVLGQKNAGFHEQRVTLNEQSSGVYFLQLKAGEQAQVMKISFIK